jgi:hypothetical protein
MENITKEEEVRYIQLQQMALDYARVGNSEVLGSMIDAGLSVNLLDTKDNSLLMLAAYNGNLETCKMLLDNGANPNTHNAHGQSILAGAAFKGYLDICKLLVENGAIIENGITKSPIVFAMMFGRFKVASYLKSQKRLEQHRYVSFNDLSNNLCYSDHKNGEKL